MKSFIRFLAVPVGAILAGIAAGQAASALGHNSNAGYPFPDLWGQILFWSCAVLAPPAALVIKAVANHFVERRHPQIRVSGVVAMLVIAPLLGMTAGLITQSKNNHRRQISREFYAAQQRAYKSLADQLIADPEIALREEWYVNAIPENWSPERSARDMVFRASFQPKRNLVPYTPAQLNELARRSPEARILVASHPNCSARLIEEVWSDVKRSGQSSAMEAIIVNPSTPRYLLERYADERKLSENQHHGWLERLLLRRLAEEKSN